MMHTHGEQRIRMMKRHWHLIALLRSWGWVSLERLASETRVSTRTIRRDLDALQEVGIPIEKSDEYNGDWRIMRGAPCPCCGHDRKHRHAQFQPSEESHANAQ